MALLRIMFIAGALCSAASACAENYTVTLGDSCWGIAVSKSVSMKNLQAWNTNVNCGRLHPGDEMCVSQRNVPCKYHHHVVQGDSCYKIAQKEETTVQHLFEMNPNLINSPYDCPLFPGQKVCVV
ncbi:spore coat assembly protein SafA [Ophiocordyceps camponoti-floridani]|uniref:Spore coat assembly protein SafA n=1 Tax=Ophiocordyceps camponoti-floridani TaxID=2030778 RepID=A0A8H4VFF1_9HYPO|nr:spore coat assembly protein SafA [Ophiocordyceps camponoti-floridani]